MIKHAIDLLMQALFTALFVIGFYIPIFIEDSFFRMPLSIMSMDDGNTYLFVFVAISIISMLYTYFRPDPKRYTVVTHMVSMYLFTIYFLIYALERIGPTDYGRIVIGFSPYYCMIVSGLYTVYFFMRDKFLKLLKIEG